MEVNDSISHDADIIVECQDFDPTNPNKKDGTIEM